MCGITGFVSFTEMPECCKERLCAMVQTLFHRGPDESGMQVLDHVAMGMRRLSIIDLKTGSQPVFNETGSIWTVFNGEIYNFRELRKELSNKGHEFQTCSDTEVIVHAYEEYGTGFPKLLNGIFAIALHDRMHNSLLLIRDHLGVKPLYYAMGHRFLVFGSEIKAILASGLVSRSLNMDALAEFLSWEYVPGERTLFCDVQKILPGCTIQIDLKTAQSIYNQYWNIPIVRRPIVHADREWIDTVDDQIRRSTTRQMVSDVPVGAFLSGGVDSSLIVASMGHARTFSIGFEDPSYNELRWARRVARHLGVDHTDTVMTPDIVTLFERLMYFMDDPIGDFSIFPTYLVSWLAKKHVKVVLSGDGGDELFGGYETYVAENMSRLYMRIPLFFRNRILERIIGRLKPTSQKKGLINKLIRFVEGIRYPASLAHARWRFFMGEAVRNSLFTREALDEMTYSPESHIDDLFRTIGDIGSTNRCLYADVKSYLCDNILTKVDRMSMAVSLEARVPYLDPEMVELAFQIPERLKVHRSQTKIILKRVASRYVPKECIYRAKEGFSIPMKSWLNREFKLLMDTLLNQHRICSDGLFQWDTIERLKREHRMGTANHSHMLWSLVVFQDWKRRWLDTNPSGLIGG
jgi:asparagine synthase (glutamine-hydrolysing)